MLFRSIADINPEVIYFAGHLEKVVLKKRYRQIECKKEEICNEIKELRRTV